jgi:hypothetical protein
MRSELKYYVPDAHRDALRAALRPYTTLDPHGAGYEGRGYTVRSIYLDTPTLTDYHAKKAGLKTRHKVRIRGYNTYRPGDWVFLEIKRKIDQSVSKNRAPTSLKNLAPLFETADVERYVYADAHYVQAHADARRFFFYVLRDHLRPTAMTVYEREAFLGRFDPTLRVTFDANLRGAAYPSPSRLFCEEQLRTVRPGFFILEVKFNTYLPGWLKNLLGRHGLRQRAISKYCRCLEAVGGERASSLAVRARTRLLHRPQGAGGG